MEFSHLVVTAQPFRIVINPKPCPIDLYVKVESSDKEEMIKTFVAKEQDYQDRPDSSDVLSSDSLPRDRYAEDSLTVDGWIKFSKPILYL